MKTYSTKTEDIKREWHVVDASGETLGKLAVKVAGLLLGKHKAYFAPNLDTGDYVIVINATQIKVTGNKMKDKMYYHHSMYPGGLKTASLEEMLAQHPERVIEHAVKGMLPHNNLGRAIIKKLKVYAGDKHPHQAQIGVAETNKGGKS
jgi:large subunit ribosomal protein L13